MIYKIFRNSFFQNSLTLSVALLVYSLILVNRSSGILRSLSMIIRSGFALTVLIVIVAIYLSFRIPGWIGRLLSLTITLTIFSLALAGLWASVNTEAGLLNGVIPMYDSATYYTDAVRLLTGDAFSITSSRRPLFSAFFAVLLKVSDHNLMVAHALMTLIVALSCYVLVREIQITHGAEAATLVFLVVFFYYRYHSGAARTEALGVALSALGTGMIWQGIRENRQRAAWFGIFLMTMALIARAGAFFVLPFILLWGAWFFRPDSRKLSWRFLVVGIVIIAAAFAINQFAIQSFGSPDTVPFGNFSYSLYGLASGGNSWAYVFEVHPEIQADSAGEMEIYRLIVDLILDNPTLLVKGALKNWAVFFSNTGYGMYSFMMGNTAIINGIVYWGLLTFALLGIISWLKNARNAYASLVILASAGLFLSVPFLPPTDTYRVRAYAASIVIFGLLPAIGLYSALRLFKKLTIAKKQTAASSNIGSNWVGITQWFSVFLVVSVVFGPFFIKGIEDKPPLGGTGCGDLSSSIVVRYDAGTVINLLPQEEIFLDWAPQVHVGVFRKNIHNFPDTAFISWSDVVKPGQSLFYGLEYRFNTRALVLIPTKLLPQPPVVMELCGSWEVDEALQDYHIFYADSVGTIIH